MHKNFTLLDSHFKASIWALNRSEATFHISLQYLIFLLSCFRASMSGLVADPLRPPKNAWSPFWRSFHSGRSKKASLSDWLTSIANFLPQMEALQSPLLLLPSEVYLPFKVESDPKCVLWLKMELHLMFIDCFCFSRQNEWGQDKRHGCNPIPQLDLVLLIKVGHLFWRQICKSLLRNLSAIFRIDSNRDDVDDFSGGIAVCLLIDTSSSLGILPTSPSSSLSSLVTFGGRQK